MKYLHWIFIFLVIWSLGHPDPALPFLKCKGREIVDPNGNPILLRGMGLGGWLVPEGYMLHIPGRGSPASIRKLILDLIGPENTDQFYQLYQANYVNEKDIQLIAGWGFNSIRLPLHYQLLTPADQPGVYSEAGFQLVDSLIAWCKRSNMYVILDLHCAPGGQNSDNISDSDGEAKLWTVPENQDRTVALWQEIARRYAKEEWIAGYDLLNEPVMPTGYNNQDLRSLYLRICQAIRQLDNNHIIFIEGSWYATDFDKLTPPFSSNMAYSFHKYWNELNLASIQNFLALRNQWSVPLWMGESGENSNPWFYECVQLLEQNKISWCWWTHKKIETRTSPLSVPIPPAYQTVLDYWNGRTSKPSLLFAKTALFDLAKKLALDQCVFQPDVLRALFDPEFGTRPKPFVTHSLPGIIPCAEYDFGANQIAYFDSYALKTKYEASWGWNEGGAYRNDGVDLETSFDTQGSLYAIGHIVKNEWVGFTVNISVAGFYDFSARVASAASSGKFKMLIDEQAFTNDIPVPNSGGWTTWRTVSVNRVQLPAGEHFLKLSFTGGDFNINQLKFILQEAGVEEGKNPEPEQFFLGQNYPNPFNQKTVIPLNIAENVWLSVNIYNTSGEFVRTLIENAVPAGPLELAWDGRDEQSKLVGSGIYFCRLNLNGLQQTRPMIYLR
ncbi:cellulase family glycosylhydrolase [candidate division KSB1 bacterium]|nr:cellulase family glycosylhydrolase [candidate division KSB1 bacterium]